MSVHTGVLVLIPLLTLVLSIFKNVNQARLNAKPCEDNKVQHIGPSLA